ncbi:NADPH oxidase regulator NoxR [Infundibulicybe gibba]|nr:NADPH oxidase regulator NoxR [Infundibulicybe gibba]
MSLKAELETWANALKAYDEEDFEKSLDLFSQISESSKIQTNMGLIFATLGEHETAVERFRQATLYDQYLAVAYFQCGVSNFLLTRFDLAQKDFEGALLYLRGNQTINYEQLGLKFKLHCAEVLFNQGLSRIYRGRMQEGLADLEEARRNKATDEHNVIDEAIRDQGEGYTVFSIPVGVLYRPSEKKLQNSTTKDYMGKAILVAASDPGDVYTTFSGSTRLKQGISPAGVYLDRPSADSAVTLERSVTAPAVMVPKPDSDVRPSPLNRSQTTINVPPNARELTSGGPVSTGSPKPMEAPPPVFRSNTIGRSPSSGPIGGPVRGLSVRRAGTGPNSPKDRTPPAPAPLEKDNRLTEFYDDYLESYGEENPPPLPNAVVNTAPPDRVAAWARSNAAPGYPPVRSGSRSAPTSNYAPSSYGGGSLRRKVTRRGVARAPSRIQSAYEEEEEGYVSGEYEDTQFELIKIRVKLHYQDDVRGMALSPEMPFEEFMEKVTSKFGKNFNGLKLQFKDEDGGRVTLRDESDYDLAIETARESSKGKPEGKLEVWCTDV